LLLKGERGDSPPGSGGFSDVYKDLLEMEGFHVTLVPVLQFNYVNSTQISPLLASSTASSFVLTSTRAVTALSKALQEGSLKCVQDRWKEKKVFCVGPGTAKAAQDMLGLSPLGEDSGSAAALAETVLTSCEKGERVIFFKGNLAKDTMREILENGGMLVEELVVYETKESIELEMDLASIQLPDWVVLVSPSGARAALPLLGQGRSFKLVAIGETVGFGQDPISLQGQQQEMRFCDWASMSQELHQNLPLMVCSVPKSLVFIRAYSYIRVFEEKYSYFTRIFVIYSYFCDLGHILRVVSCSIQFNHMATILQS